MEQEPRIYTVHMDDGVVYVGMKDTGNEIVKFGGATAMLIYMTWVNHCGQGGPRADDFIAGFVQGLTYCAINGAPSAGDITVRNHTGDPKAAPGSKANTGGTLSVGGAMTVVDADGHEKD